MAAAHGVAAICHCHRMHDAADMSLNVRQRRVFLADALKKSDPQLLEPIMAVEVETPEQYMGDVMGNLSGRRGKIEGMEDRRNSKLIRAKVPLGEMFGYATDLRSQTQGRASYTMQFDSYEPAPKSIVDEVMSKNA